MILRDDKNYIDHIFFTKPTLFTYLFITLTFETSRLASCTAGCTAGCKV